MPHGFRLTGDANESNPIDPIRALCAGVLSQAVTDARGGDLDAAWFLVSDSIYCDAAGLDYQAYFLQAKKLMRQAMAMFIARTSARRTTRHRQTHEESER